MLCTVRNTNVHAKEMREKRDRLDSEVRYDLKESCFSVLMDIVHETHI